jgi:2-polyprenyl-3-methyl-5-hydroxy-6-metoxy-1,4-benzoquinol methylase
VWITDKYNILKKYTFSEIMRKFFTKLANKKPRESSYVPPLREVFANLELGSHGMQKLIDDYAFETILDIGCGKGVHSDIFIGNNKKVTCIDYGDSIYFKENKNKISAVVADFNTWETEEKFDAAWCSHVLEHQLNVNAFLVRIFHLLKDDGVLAITVPPGENLVIGGHLTNWNAGILLYNLVLAGFDCSNASVLQYGYNITVIVKKVSDHTVDLSSLSYDCGDLRKITSYLPNVEYRSNDRDDPFLGNIHQLNW